MIGTGLLLASLSISIGGHGVEKSPYDVALEYCRDKGGLAVYMDNGGSVEFSCADQLTRMIYIFRD